MPEPQITPLAMLTADDICKLLRVGRTWLYTSVKSAAFPRPAVQLPRCSRWSAADVQQWLAAQGASNQHRDGQTGKAS